MSKYIVDSSLMTEIADNIRLKTGEEGNLVFPTGFNAAIESLPSIEDMRDIKDKVDDIKDIFDSNESEIDKTITTPVDIASFNDGADDLPVKELKVAIDPVQDLHGYDHPWPAGGGKNKTDHSTPFVGTVGEQNNYTIFTMVLPAGTYTYSCKQSVAIPSNTRNTLGVKVGENKIVYEYVVGIDYNPSNLRHKMTFTVSEESTCTFCYWSHTPSVSATLTEWQVEEGSSFTGYAPYSNICPISGWTGAKVTRTGKNLLNISPITLSAQGIWANNKELDKPIPAGTYTFAVTTSAQSAWTVYFKDENGDRVGQGASALNTQGRQSVTITLTGTATKIGGYLNAPATMSEFQLELGSTATDYEPYQGETYDITFPTEAGTVYGGELTIHADGTGDLVVKKADLDLGTVPWMRHQSKSVFRTYNQISSMSPSTGGGIVEDFICDSYKTETWSHVLDAPGYDCCICEGWGGSSYIAINDTRFNDYTAEQFKAAMSGVHIVYNLATPITYQLTPTEIRTLLGVNNIWADTGDINEIEYSADSQLCITNKLNELDSLLSIYTETQE